MKVVRFILIVDALLLIWIISLCSVLTKRKSARDVLGKVQHTFENSDKVPPLDKKTEKTNRRKVTTSFASSGGSHLPKPIKTKSRIPKNKPPPVHHNDVVPKIIPSAVTVAAVPIVEEIKENKENEPALDVSPPVVEITPEATEDETPRINEVLAQSDVGGGKDQNNHEAQLNNDWEDHVCDTVEDSICHEAFVVADMKVTFCSAAKVASTTTKTYFYKLSKDLVIPDDAQFGVHEANWIRLHMVDNEARRHILKADDWTHVFFWKRVLERFISGYLDKVVHDCETHTRIGPHLAIHHYIQYGFSCEQHTDLEAFVSFMETVPSFEGHFHAQASLCSLGRYPVSEMVCADETLSDSLKGLSASLGVEHPLEEKKSSTHSTKAKEKMVALFKDKPFLIQRILDMFKEDCEIIPGACNVDELMTGIEAATKVVE